MPALAVEPCGDRCIAPRVVVVGVFGPAMRAGSNSFFGSSGPNTVFVVSWCASETHVPVPSSAGGRLPEPGYPEDGAVGGAVDVDLVGHCADEKQSPPALVEQI